MVDQHAEPAAGAGAELGDPVGEDVDAVQGFDDDAFDAQVVTPDAFDELGVVLAFDPDAGVAGDAGLQALDLDRAGRRDLPAGAFAGALTGTSVTGLPSSRKPAGANGKTRWRPLASSSTTLPYSIFTTAPQKPLTGSSTTRPGSAGTSGTFLRRRLASTSS